MGRSNARRAGRSAIAIAGVVVTVAFAPAATSAGTAKPPGVVAPPPGSGIGAPAALDNPACDRQAGPYGRFDFVYEGGGGVCVAPFEAGARNGGATSQGVTKDSIKLVVVTPTPMQAAGGMGTGIPMNLATGERGLMSDAFVDTVAAFEHAYETWGRKIELEFVPSTGSDEAAQRSDALSVKQLKPFAMIDATVVGLDVLETSVAQDGIMVNGYATSTEKALKQAPYRWGQADSQASVINAAEFAGKQLVGKKAQWAGDESLRSKPRVFASIYTDGVVDISQFDREFARYKGKSKQNFPYTSNGSPLGDPVRAQEAAPTIVQKIKSLGVTSVLLFSDIGMNTAVLAEATKQEYRPEWIITGSQYQDVVFLARNYDLSQWAHAFGISAVFPGVADGSTTLSPVQWYWGQQGTAQVVVDSWLGWFFEGVQAAGPKLTPKTFRQGLFATPAQGGAATGDPTTGQAAYGRTAGLPYDEYLRTSTDFAPVWFDAATSGASNLFTSITGKGVEWYLDGGTRYAAGQWPTKRLPFFEKEGAILSFSTRPPHAVAPCTGCPSDGGPGTPSQRSS